MDKTDHLMAEKNKNNKDSQKGQVTPKKSWLPKYSPEKCKSSFGFKKMPIQIAQSLSIIIENKMLH